MTGRRALLTGGRAKIGMHIALRLLRDGADSTITTGVPPMPYTGSPRCQTALDSFAATLDAAFAQAQNDALVTFGVVPDSAATSFGYLELGSALPDGGHVVTSFREKPTWPTLPKLSIDYAVMEPASTSGEFTVAALPLAGSMSDPGRRTASRWRPIRTAAEPAPAGLCCTPAAETYSPPPIPSTWSRSWGMRDWSWCTRRRRRW